MDLMASPAPPLIFSPRRRLAARRRAMRLQRLPGAARYILDDMVEDMVERLAFLRHRPRRALTIGDCGELSRVLAGQDCEVTGADPAAGWDLERPYPAGGFDLIACFGLLDTVNDLPGALIHVRNALARGGLAIATFPGAGSLPRLRAAMLAADGERPAPRLHPMIDVRAGGQLLQRAGWADPVIDSRSLEVRFRSFGRLVSDLREQGLGNVLANPGPPLSRSSLLRAAEAFGTRTVERFELLTLSGWRR